jgi:riboflavin kinase/FMN adenylyltransferase
MLNGHFELTGWGIPWPVFVLLRQSNRRYYQAEMNDGVCPCIFCFASHILTLAFFSFCIFHFTFPLFPSAFSNQTLVLPHNMIKVHKDLSQLPSFNNAVITIGTFDGVHAGHQQIIRQLQKEAAAIGGETVIITFHPHPRSVVKGRSSIKVLNTLDEKVELLNANGIQHVVVVPFTEAFASQTAEEYIKSFLVETFRPHTIIIGYDHKFGKGREGDYHLLEAMADQYGFLLKEIPEHILNNITVSSTRIREAISSTNIETANNNLGYTYFFEGEVVHGNKLGRTLGYPTANIQLNDETKLLPADGIYAVEARLANSDEILKGMMSIGVRPTIGESPRVIEVNLFDFDKDIYGQTLRVYVKHYLRPELKFDNLDALKTQIAADEVQSKTLLDK